MIENVLYHNVNMTGKQSIWPIELTLEIKILNSITLGSYHRHKSHAVFGFCTS